MHSAWPKGIFCRGTHRPAAQPPAFGIGSPQARSWLSHEIGGWTALPLVVGTHAPPDAGAEAQRTLAGSYDSETKAAQFPSATVRVPGCPEQVLSLKRAAVPTWQDTPCGAPHEHEGQLDAGVPLLPRMPLVTSVGKPLALAQDGGVPEPCQTASGPTHPPPGVLGAQVKPAPQSGSAQSMLPS